MAGILPTAVYLLCFLTSASCSWLLGRSYRSSGVRLLLWSSICFGLLAVNNLALVFDMVILPAVDLRLVRVLLALAGVLALLWGFVWEGAED
jgi:hypothetical protein